MLTFYFRAQMNLSDKRWIFRPCKVLLRLREPRKRGSERERQRGGERRREKEREREESAKLKKGVPKGGRCRWCSIRWKNN